MLRDDLYNEIVQLPVIDVHSHISAKNMAAKKLGDIMFYHMLLYPLRSSGVDQNLLWPEGESIHRTGRPYDEFIRNWPRIANTGFGWILRTILRELYDFDAPITRGSPHPIARAASCFTDSLGYLLSDFPDLHFNILSGYEPDEPLLCALCLGYPNVSLGGFWWQTFYPSVMHAAWHRRLDMVPTAKLAGFFSDGYCVDWMFGRLRLTQRVLANVLSEKIDHGFLDFDQALGMAKDVLFNTPEELFLKGRNAG